MTDADAVEAAVTTLAGAARDDRTRADAVVVHAAAYTDVGGAERDRETAFRVNVLGTRNVAAACARHGVVLVHVSTDYVFWGGADEERSRRGGYAEGDETGPVRNHYALTKLMAESEARAAPRHLVLRTSFRPRTWPYPRAFTDVRTSQTYVDELAPELAEVILRAPDLVDRGVRTLHVAGRATTVFELARRRAPGVEPASKVEAGVALPDDVVLSSALWQRLSSTRGSS